MVAGVARRGYPATTIGDVVALAHVSRSTFYQQFASKQDCLEATYEQLVSDSVARVARAYRSREGWRERLRAAFAEFVAVVVADPAAARLVIVDGVALGGGVAAHRERAARAFELLLRQSFDQAPGGGHVAAATITALVGGMRRVVYVHLRAGTVGALPAQVHDLLEWTLRYQLPAGALLAAPRDPERPNDAGPEGGGCARAPRLPHARLRYSQRERILIAVRSLVCERGYGALTIPTISARAGVSNQTFYQHFAAKENAFLAAFEDGAARALAATAPAFERQPGWPEAVCAGIDALLGFLAAEPAFAKLAFVELPGAGPAALERAELALDAFAAFLRPGLDRRAAPGVLVQATTGAVRSVIDREIAHGHTAALPALAPCIAYVALAPFIGAEQAARQLTERALVAPPAAATRS